MKSSSFVESLYFNLRLLITTIICVIIFYFANEFIYDDDILDIVFILLFFVYIICFGVYNDRIEKFVVASLQQVYIAHNINIEKGSTDAFIPNEILFNLPYYSTLKKRKKPSSSKKFTTYLADLNLSIKVDSVTIKDYYINEKDEKVLHLLYGYGFVVDTDECLNDGEKIIYSRSHLVHDAKPENLITMGDGSIMYSANEIKDAERYINFFNYPIFKPENQYNDVIAIVEGSRVYLIIENIVQRPLYFSLFWTTKKIDKALSKEKRAIYNYNQKIVDLSRAIESLKVNN